MAQLKDLLVTGDSRVIGNNYNNNPKVAFGTCSTAAATAEKIVTIADPTWNLQVGDLIAVKFTNTNSASTVKLNVNGSGAIQISANTSRPYTSTSTQFTGYANRTLWYQYDGTYWHWLSGGYDANDNTYPSAYCSTAAGTAAKAASCTGYVLLNNSYLHIVITNSNTSAGALTLNVNGKGAKPIYINGAASSSSNYTLPAGSYLVFYNGTNYDFRTDGKLTASITGDAATVNGKTVGVNVPADAKFTDNNTTYTFANGTNGFTVTPSGGSAQTVTVTPSISNNVTGSGEPGAIAKFNGTNTVTTGPQLGSATDTFLRNDSSWVNPQNVYVGSTAPSGSNYNVWVDTTGAVNNTAFINLVYPVGSVYLSVNNTNPGTLFGVGTWEKLSGRYLYANAGTSFEQSSYTGAGTQNHTLTINEMPSHAHYTSNFNGGGQTQSQPTTNAGVHGDPSYRNFNNAGVSNYVGGNQAHNHNVSYMAVFVWKRTA